MDGLTHINLHVMIFNKNAKKIIFFIDKQSLIIKMPLPGIEPGLWEPQSHVLTFILQRHLNILMKYPEWFKDI